MNDRKYIILHEKIPPQFKYNAGSKARNDIEFIFQELGGDVFFVDNCKILDRRKLSIFNKFLFHLRVLKSWIKQLSNLSNGSVVVIQYPVFFHTVYFDKIINLLHKKGCFVIAIIHDLETLRFSYNKDLNRTLVVDSSIIEEKRSIPLFDKVIVHNNLMKEKAIELFSLESSKVESIKIFDYLISNPQDIQSKPINVSKVNYSIIIAGNLDLSKSGYVYKLPSNCSFELYGPNYSGLRLKNIHYNGFFLPDELPYCLNGDFGLVWDGPETSTCRGATGSYLRYNNPHKTSLYLACGIPVIIWKEAAMAKFINENECGITIESLDGLNSILRSITADKYKKMKINAEKIGQKLRNGYFTRLVIEKELNFSFKSIH